MLVVFLGMTAFVVDIGHAMLVQRELQISVNAAALAGAQSLPNGNYTAAATKYSSAPGNLNATIDSSVTVNSPTITPECLALVTNNFGFSCELASGSSPMVPNAIKVVETAKVPMFFAEVLGFKSLTVSATATASRGSQPLPLNVAIILDSTPSMDEGDSSCGASGGNTQMTCAQYGARELVTGLNPTMDRISLFTFPNVLASTIGNDTDCNSRSAATPELITFPGSTKGMSAQGQSISQTNISLGSYYTGGGPLGGGTPTTSRTGVAVTYQIADYSTDFKSSGNGNSNTLNTTSSSLVDAVGGKSGCPGMQTADEYTYFAGALFAAQATLLQQSYDYPGSQNVIVLLSDGNSIAHQADMITQASLPAGSTALYATSSGIYPSWIGQCGQAVDAAGEIKSEGTWIFAVAYGSPTTSAAVPGGDEGLGNCPSDIPVKGAYAGKHPNITPCQTMQAMSGGSNPTLQYFFADNYISKGAACTGGPVGDLAAIFSAITGELTASRLIPNNSI